MTDITTIAVIVNETITTCSFVNYLSAPNLSLMETALVMSALAKTNVARARWDVTTAGRAPESTVTMPSITWPHNGTTVSVASFVIVFGHRYFFHAKIAVAITNAVTTKVHTLCVYSMRTGVVNVGIICPLQRGQSGHASCDPVDVTMPPKTIRTYTETAVARETDWKAPTFTATGHPLL